MGGSSGKYRTAYFQPDKRNGQVSSLHGLAVKASATLSDMPGSPNRNLHRMEDVIVKIADLEEQINGDISFLVDVKKEMGADSG